jgi:uncharacterized membrane protein
MTEAWAIAFVLFAAFLGSFGSLYLKKGSARLSRNMRQAILNPDLFKGIIIYGSSTVFYVIGIKGGELSVLFPLISTGYIWVAFLSMKYFHEAMNRKKWAGIALILVGVSLIGMGSS